MIQSDETKLVNNFKTKKLWHKVMTQSDATEWGYKLMTQRDDIKWWQNVWQIPMTQSDDQFVITHF